MIYNKLQPIIASVEKKKVLKIVLLVFLIIKIQIHTDNYTSLWRVNNEGMFVAVAMFNRILSSKEIIMPWRSTTKLFQWINSKTLNQKVKRSWEV